MTLGRLSSAGLLLSGLAGVLIPKKVASALALPTDSGRGIAETRAGLGGTYAALGAWALLTDSPAANMAIGVTWAGAAAVRVAALALDKPRTDAAYWAYLAAEVGLGMTALVAARSVTSRQPSGDSR